VRIGLIGAGAIARRHVGVLATQPDCEVVAVGDVDPARAEALVAPGGRVYTSGEALLEREQLDAVFVCTPPAAHREPAIAALMKGVPTYLEKPLARDLVDGAAIDEAWRDSGTVCAVGYQWRSLGLLDRVRSALGGRPPGMLISRSIGPTEPGRAASWFGDPASSGGILFELGSHDINLQLALSGGRAESVHAVSASGLLAASQAETRLDDAVAVTVSYEGGAIGVVAVAWAEHADPPTYTLDIVAHDAALRLTLDPEFRLEGTVDGVAVAMREQADPRVTSVAGFLDAVRAADAGLVRCAPADALETLRVALGAERSIDGGAPISWTYGEGSDSG
jgi:myo-inositol 2-dehydrogenase/D-chiro-inositol 1-dehydrogenase